MSKYEIENVKLTAPKLDRNDLEYAMTYRYACKKFDSTKKDVYKRQLLNMLRQSLS